MTTPGGVIATVYVNVLPRVQQFAAQLRQSLRASSRQLRGLDRELAPVTRALSLLGRTATGIVPGIQLTRQSLLALGGHAVTGNILSAAGALSTLSGTLAVVPAAGAAAASVLGTLTVGLFGVDDALEEFADEEKFTEKLEALSTNARATLGVINELRGELTVFRDTIQDQLFAGLDQVARDLAGTFLPRLTTHFSDLAATINLGAKDLAAFAQSGATLRDVDEITSNTQLAFHGLRAALVPAATALRDVVTVGSRFLPELVALVVELTNEFANWIARLRATGQLDEFIRSGIEGLRQFIDILKNVGRIIIAVLGAAEDSGNGLLDTLERLTGKAADFFESGRGQNLVKDFLDSAREAGRALIPVIVALGDLLFNSVLPILIDFAERVGPAVAAFFDGLGDALDTAAPGIRAFATGFAQFISALIPVLPLLGQLLGQLATLVGILAARLGPVIAQIATAIGNVLLPILQVLSAIFLVIPDSVLKFAVVIGVVIVAIGGLVTVIRGVQAVMGLFAAGLDIVASGALRTQKGVTGLLGFLGGPWGLIIGAATLALGLFLSVTDSAGEEQQHLATAAQGLNDVIREQNGVINENVRIKAAEQLESEGALSLAKQLGISTKDVTDAYLQQGDALDRVRDRLQANIAALEEQNRKAEQTRGGGARSQEIEAEIARNQTLLDLLGGLVDARNADAEATNREALAAFGAITPMNAWRAVVEGTTFAINELVNAQQHSQQVQLESLNSEIAYFNQLERTRQELTQGEMTLDIHSQAGRDNLTVITQLVAAGTKRIQDLQAQNRSTAEITAATEQMQNELIALVQPFFANRDAARAFLTQLGLLPNTVTVTVLTNLNQVAAAAFAAAQAIRNIPNAFFGVGNNARGGPVRQGEWSVVGEEGPELVRFGRSARVFSNDESERMVRDVGELDTMTRGTTTTGPTTSPGTAQTVQVNDQINLSPTISVFLDGREIKNVVRVELDARDRQLQRLITTHAGTRR